MTIAAFSLLFAVGAIAQETGCPHQDPNNICIIFDYPDECCQNCWPAEGAPFPGSGALSAYVVLQNCTQPAGVSGYEFCLCRDGGTDFVPPPGCYVTGYTYPPGAINAATEPCFAVGLAIPLPNDGFCTLLLTINLLIFCPDCWCFGVKPSVPSSIPDQMAYADGLNPGLLIPMTPCTCSELVWDPCAMTCINCQFCPPGPPITSEQSTWGVLKSLYR
jgi:hypothetical protein